MASLPSRALAALGAAAVISIAGPSVAAPSISVNPNPTRQLGDNHSESIEKRYYITRDDCVSDDAFAFKVTIRDASNYNLEIWASQSADCSDVNLRQTGSARCWRVYSQDANNDSYDVLVRMQDIAARAEGQEVEGTSTAAACEPGDLTTGGIGLKLYFLLLNGDELGGSKVTFDTGLDLRGPDPPDDIGIDVAEDKLAVSWTITDSDDWNGYRLYCASAAAAADFTASLGSGGTGTTSGSTAGGAGGVATATGGDATTTDTTTGTVSGACDFGVLVPGEIPSDAFICGEAKDARLTSDGLATGLTDGETYAVGVAGLDLLGNPGPLSSVVCGTPQPVTTFYEAYRAAGGTAGGGFCSLGGGRRPALGGALLVAAALLTARRRRRAGV